MRVLEELALVKSAVFLLAWLVTGMGGGGEPYDGQLIGVQPEEIRVTQRTQEQFFAVNEQTKITLDGRSVKLTELPLGSRVLVVSESSEAAPLAKRIAATSLRLDGNGSLAERQTVRR